MQRLEQQNRPLGPKTGQHPSFWCGFNAFMTAIRFAGGRLYAWICVIEFKSLVRDNFDRVGTYKKVFGSFGLMDVKRGGVGSILSYPMSQGSETRVYLSRHQRSRRDSQVRLMLEGHFACEPHSGCRSWRCSTRASG